VEQEERLSRVFAALADPTRRDVVRRLATADATLTDLASAYDVSVQAVAKHLKVLEDAGLVRRTREAQRRPATLNAEVLDLRSIFGLEATVTTPAVATDGAYVEMDMVLEPGGHTNDRYHPAQEKTFQVLAGTLEIFWDGDWHKVPAEESSTVPRGATHAARNATETPAPCLNTHRPASAAAAAAGIDPRGLPLLRVSS